MGEVRTYSMAELARRAKLERLGMTDAALRALRALRPVTQRDDTEA